MNQSVMVEVKNLKKRYRLGEIGTESFRQDLQSWWARRRGKDDPLRRIGEEQDFFYALKGLSLTFRRGESIGIIGENGAGKSTFLKLLSRVMAPTEGSIDLYGRVTSMLEVGTGFDGEMTGRENIYMNGAILGMTKSEIDAKIEEIIEFSELREFIDTPVKRYSSGMYTKLGFAVASHLDSVIIIMDEVLAVGDIAFQNKCLKKMKEAVTSEGKTVLYVSHNMNQIRQLCDRVIVLNRGNLVFDGNTGEAIEFYLKQFQTEKHTRDYREEIRPDWLHDERIRIVSAEYRDRDSIYFYRDEPMKLHMVLQTEQDVEKLGLRIEVSNTNDVKLGTYFLYDICDCHAGEKIELDIDVDISSFTNDTYNTIYCFFVRDEAGTNLNVDRVYGLSFVHEDSLPARNLNWETENWGYLALPGAEVIRVEKH